MKRVLVCDVGAMAEPSHVPLGPSKAGKAREWSVVARRSHRGADRADISFAFACVCGYLKWKFRRMLVVVGARPGAVCAALSWTVEL